MADIETIESQEQVEEGMGDVIRLGTLLTLLAIPGVIEAKDISEKLPKDKVTAVDVQNSIKKSDNEAKKTYGGYTQINAANILARTLFAEARGEGEKGIDAVASVILNRSNGKAENFPKVCLAKKQFSCWNDKKDLTPDKYKYLMPVAASKPGKDREMWLYCQKIAGQMMFGEFKSTIGNRNAYHTISVTPSWDTAMSDKTTIGNHIFGYLPEYNGNKANPSNFYKIRKGDSISKIAKAKNTTVEEILKLNPNIKNPDKIFVGMKLKLPS